MAHNGFLLSTGTAAEFFRPAQAVVQHGVQAREHVQFVVAQQQNRGATVGTAARNPVTDIIEKSQSNIDKNSSKLEKQKKRNNYLALLALLVALPLSSTT